MAIAYDPLKDVIDRRKRGLPLERAEPLFYGPFIEQVGDRFD